jgi:hypothetical protein
MDAMRPSTIAAVWPLLQHAAATLQELDFDVIVDENVDHNAITQIIDAPLLASPPLHLASWSRRPQTTSTMSACINLLSYLRPLRDRETNDPLTITLRIYMMYTVMEDMKLKLCQLDTLFSARAFDIVHMVLNSSSELYQWDLALLLWDLADILELMPQMSRTRRLICKIDDIVM